MSINQSGNYRDNSSDSGESDDDWDETPSLDVNTSLLLMYMF